jgi:hypothetical protein
MTPRPPRGEISNRGRGSRKAAEKAWEQELGMAERRGAKRVRDRLLALREEHHEVVNGIEYVEWSVIAAALEEEVRPLADPTARPPTESLPSDDEAGPAPTATAT